MSSKTFHCRYDTPPLESELAPVPYHSHYLPPELTEQEVIFNARRSLNQGIDLSKIDFLDSSGLGALVQTAKECKKSKLGFSVVGNSRVAQTIKLVRLGDFLNLKSSLEEALN